MPEIRDPEELKYLNGGEITDPDELAHLNAPQTVATQAPEVAKDIGKSAATGVRDFFTGIAGLPGDIQHGMRTVGNYLTGKPEGDYAPWTSAQLPSQFPTSAEVAGQAEKTFPAHVPQTPLGQFARTTGGFLPAAAMGMGEFTIPEAATRIASQALIPATGAEAAAGAARMALPGAGDNSTAQDWARALGAGVAGLAGRGIVTPNPRSAAQNIDKQILAGQPTGDITKSMTGPQLMGLTGDWGRSPELDNRTMGAMNKALLYKAGGTVDTIPGMDKSGNLIMKDPVTGQATNAIEQNSKRIGAQIDAIAGRNRFVPDNQLWNELRTKAGQFNPIEPNDKAYVVRQANNIANRFGYNQPAAVYRGAEYQEASSKLAKLARDNVNNPGVSRMLYSLRESLDNAFERTVGVTNPQDLGAIRAARGQWRANLALEDAFAKGDKTSSQGWLIPGAVKTSAEKIYDNPQNPFSELARAGDATGIATSRATQKAGVFQHLSPEGELYAGLATEHTGFGKGLLGAMAARAGGKAIAESPAVRAWSKNQLLPKTESPFFGARFFPMSAYAAALAGGAQQPGATLGNPAAPVPR